VFLIFYFNLWEASYHIRYFYPFLVFFLNPLTHFVDDHFEKMKKNHFENKKLFFLFYTLLPIFLLGTTIKRNVILFNRNHFLSPMVIFKFQSPDLDCLNDIFHRENLGVKNGLVTFWPYKIMKAFSPHENWKMKQVFDDFSNQDWLVNLNWYPKENHYEYFVTETYRDDSVVNGFHVKFPDGQIKKIHRCKDYSLYLTSPLQLVTN
jgi:hypothetical protein